MQLDDIGFPASQLLTNGLPLKAAEKVGNAFWTEKDMRILLTDAELTPVISSIIERLENHSARGKEVK